MFTTIKEQVLTNHWFALRAAGLVLAIGGVFLTSLPAGVCIFHKLYLTNSTSSNSSKVFAGIAAKTSAMFLSLPVKARLEEMSFSYPCQETPRGRACTRRKGRGGGGVGISPIKILPAKFPETHGGKRQPGSLHVQKGAAKVFFNSAEIYRKIQFIVAMVTR